MNLDIYNMIKDLNYLLKIEKIIDYKIKYNIPLSNFESVFHFYCLRPSVLYSFLSNIDLGGKI